jgi:hypothetical protein
MYVCPFSHHTHLLASLFNGSYPTNGILKGSSAFEQAAEHSAAATTALAAAEQLTGKVSPTPPPTLEEVMKMRKKGGRRECVYFFSFFFLLLTASLSLSLILKYKLVSLHRHFYSLVYKILFSIFHNTIVKSKPTTSFQIQTKCHIHPNPPTSPTTPTALCSIT